MEIAILLVVPPIGCFVKGGAGKILRRKWNSVRTFRICPVCMKLGTRGRHIILFNICQCTENGGIEGRTIVTGANEIPLTGVPLDRKTFWKCYFTDPTIGDLVIVTAGGIYSYHCAAAHPSGGGGLAGCRPPSQIPTKLKFKNRDFVNKMMSNFVVIYSSAEASYSNRLLTGTLEFWKNKSLK